MGNSGSRASAIANRRAAAAAGSPTTPGAGAQKIAAKRVTAARVPLTTSASPQQQRAVLRQAKAWATTGRLDWRTAREYGVAIDARGKAVTPIFRSVNVGDGQHDMRYQVALKDQIAEGIRAHFRTQDLNDPRIQAEQALALRFAAQERVKEPKVDTPERPIWNAAGRVYDQQLHQLVAGFERPEFLHTHPGHGGSFSPLDIATAMREGWAAIHAVGRGPDGQPWLYTMRPGPKASRSGLWSWESTYKKYHVGATRGRHQNAVYDEFHGRFLRGEMTRTQLNNQFWHEVWTRTVREVGPDVLHYEARPLADALREAGLSS